MGMNGFFLWDFKCFNEKSLCITHGCQPDIINPMQHIDLLTGDLNVGWDAIKSMGKIRVFSAILLA